MVSKRLDVLVYLPKVLPPRMEQACIAHALEYNLCTVGATPEEAVGKLVDLVIDHCKQASAMSMSPVNLAEPYLLQAFFLGVPLHYDDEQVKAKLSQELADTLGVVDVRPLQEETGQRDLRECMRQRAA